jgi:apolipoprotein N-acyltransferase
MLLTLVANGRHTIPLAAWLSLLFLLRFARIQPRRVGLPAVWVVLFLGWAFQLRGMAPVPIAFYFVLSALYGLVLFLPFLVDRLVGSRLDVAWASLVFPTTWVAMEWLVANFTPYGSWTSMAYTQHENLVLIQLAAVTGIYGISFLIAWFAAIGCLVWERGTADSTARRSVAVYSLVMSLVLLAGGARLVLFAPDAPTVRVASLTEMDYDLFEGSNGSAATILDSGMTPEIEAGLQRNAHMVMDDFLARSEREVEAGAKIIFWGEANGFCLKSEEPAILARGIDFAREHGVYFGISPAVIDFTSATPLENKIILIDPHGNVAYEYWKGIPVPGPEAASQARGEAVIKTVDSEYGRLGSAICFDMDFPGYLQQAGAKSVDIMLVPSNDWREIDPWHSHMARFRAIEQGFNMIRHVSKGLSLATDYQGRVLASMDHYITADRNFVAHVPTRGVKTIYARVGDLFAWLCLAGMALLIVRGATRRQ